MATSADLSVRLRGPDSPWSTVGSEFSKGITVEGLTCSANERGPDTCGFTLRRDPRAAWPDLLAFNQCEITVGGVPVWGGRVWETPSQDGAERSISVAGKGWQYHLDDDLLDYIWVHTNIGDWRDSRSYATAPLATFFAGGQVNGGAGGTLQLAWPKGMTVAANGATGVTLDFGPNNLAKRIVVDYATSNNDGSNTILFYARAHSIEDMTGGSSNDAISAVPINTLGASGVTAGTFATPYRYVTCFLFNVAGGAAGVDYWVKLNKLQVFSATSYESGNASTLKASFVAQETLASGKLPLLDSSTAGIETTSFSIPEFRTQGYQTPRQILEAVNAYHDYLVGVDANRRLYFKARPSAPLFEIGDWTGAEVQDASMNAGEDLYNKVVVQYTGPDGAQTSRERTNASAILTRQGFTRTSTISPQSALTQAGADQIGDAWLANHVEAPFKGSVTSQGSGGVRQIAGGAAVHPSRLLLHCGQQLRIANRHDPANGGWGRDGIIRQVTYNHEGEQAQVSLDNSRTRLDSFLARLAVITGQRR